MFADFAGCADFFGVCVSGKVCGGAKLQAGWGASGGGLRGGNVGGYTCVDMVTVVETDEDGGVSAGGDVSVRRGVVRGSMLGRWLNTRGEIGGGGGVTMGGVGGVLLIVIVLGCLLTLPWALGRYDEQNLGVGGSYGSPSWAMPMGADLLGRSMLWRCLLGGAISLGIGVCAAGIAVCIGVSYGAIAGYAGGRVDAGMMRVVDVLYGLPYILLVVMIDLALGPWMVDVVEFLSGGSAKPQVAETIADVATLFVAIGGVSWLTMARVIRGQVLSLKSQPFVEAARACGFGPVRVMLRHLVPNMTGPIVVYATLTVPQAILQESLLSFLGIGVRAPLPSWGNLASEGLSSLGSFAVMGGREGILGGRWWLLFYPCLLLGLTLLSLNLLGDGLRRRLDPKRKH